MRKIVSILYVLVLFFSCDTKQLENNKKKEQSSSNPYYTQKVIDWQIWHNPLDNKEANSCYDYSVSLLADTIVPNYYIKYKSKIYRLDSYLDNQSMPSFWYDIFENRSKECSFILFFGEKKNEKYRYVIFDITENGLFTSKYFEIQKQVKNDTTAILRSITLNVSAEYYCSKRMVFPSFDKLSKVNFLLRNGVWTEQNDFESSLVIKHFEFVNESKYNS